MAKDYVLTGQEFKEMLKAPQFKTNKVRQMVSIAGVEEGLHVPLQVIKALARTVDKDSELLVSASEERLYLYFEITSYVEEGDLIKVKRDFVNDTTIYNFYGDPQAMADGYWPTEDQVLDFGGQDQEE